jgi:broad specificity phosphatase PhoE
VTGLHERVFYSLVGLTRTQIAQRFGSAIVHAVEHCSDTIELPGEETLGQAGQRVRSTFVQLLTGAQQRLAIVSHGGPHGWLLAAELGLCQTQARTFRLDEACFSLLTFERLSCGFQLQQILALNTRQLPADLGRRE